MGTSAPSSWIQPHERIAAFIDGANLYQSARALGFDIDYRRLLDFLATGGRFTRAYYYTALMDEQEYSPIRPLVDWLDYNGYSLVTKPLKEYAPVAGRRKFKGNMDIEIAVDLLELAPHLDHAVLISGDGDFRRLVESVQRRGLRVTVISTMRTQPPMVADELRRQADLFIELGELQPYIARAHSGRPAEQGARPLSAGAPAEGGGDFEDEYDDEYDDET